MRQRKGRKDQESRIENGDVGEKRIERSRRGNLHRGIHREVEKKQIEDS